MAIPKLTETRESISTARNETVATVEPKKKPTDSLIIWETKRSPMPWMRQLNPLSTRVLIKGSVRRDLVGRMLAIELLYVRLRSVSMGIH
jgi:hypothetical protein